MLQMLSAHTFFAGWFQSLQAGRGISLDALSALALSSLTLTLLERCFGSGEKYDVRRRAQSLGGDAAAACPQPEFGTYG